MQITRELRNKFVNGVGKWFACLCASCGIALTGCTLATTAPAVPDEPLIIAGNVHGGQQPISGATVSLYEVGLTGFGSAATFEGSTTTASDGTFSFGSANTCGSSTTLLMYIVASGGDPQVGTGVSNPASKLMSLVGSCTASKTATVVIDEVSTVATMYSLAQYFNPATESFGRSSTYASGITNAFATASILANLSTGLANTSLTTGTSFVITQTPEAQKINLIADILAACVNSNDTASTTSTNCSTLFNNAVPPPVGTPTSLGNVTTAAFPTATDTLMAAYYLAVNPINASTAGVANPTRAAALFGLASGTPPYATTATQPTDWTIGIAYTSNSTGSSTCYPFSGTVSPAVDQTGNIWWVAGASSQVNCAVKMNANGVYSSSTPSTNSLQPLQPAFILDPTNHGFYVGTSGSGSEIVGASISPTTNTVPKYNGNQITVASILADGVTGTGSPADADILALDANDGVLYEVPNGTASTSNFSVTAINNSSLSTTGASAHSIALDHAGYVWVAETGANAVSTLTYPTANAPSRSTSSTYFHNPVAIAVDNSNNAWVANSVGTGSDGFLSYVTAGSPPVPVAASSNDSGGVNNPVEVALDGASNVWVANAGQTVGGTANTGQSVSELYYNGSAIVPLSPSGSVAGFSHTYNGVSGIAVDGSGNVWVTNSAAIAGSSTSGLITEIVGAAVPVSTPISYSLSVNKLAAKP